jgi:hypothetical protein
MSMPEDPQTNVRIRGEDSGTIVVAFGACMTAADLAAAFASLPADAWISNSETTWFSQLHGCKGQVTPDEAHRILVGRIFLRPETAKLRSRSMSYLRCTDGVSRITSEEMIKRVQALGFDDQGDDVPVSVRSARRRLAGVEPYGHKGPAEGTGCLAGYDHIPEAFELKTEAEDRS